MKRKIAFLLALSMVCSFSNVICAGAALSNIGGSQENGENIQLETEEGETSPVEAAEKENSETQPEINSAAEQTALGRVDVSIGNTLPLDGNVDFTVSLSSGNGFAQDSTAQLSNSKEATVSFDGLLDGVYTLTVHGSGFADYSQTITVEQKLYAVRLTAGFCAGYAYEKGGLHPGVILIGDVDGDGDTDNADKDMLVDVIDSGILPEGTATDLNLDGRTDLEDLVLLSTGLETDKDTAAAIQEYIAPAAVRTAVPEGTSVEG